MNILVKSVYDKYKFKFPLEIIALEIKYLGRCTSCLFIVSQFQIRKFGLLCESGSGPITYFSLVIFTMLSFVNRGRQRNIAGGRFASGLHLASLHVFAVWTLSPASSSTTHGASPAPDSCCLADRHSQTTSLGSAPIWSVLEDSVSSEIPFHEQVSSELFFKQLY